MNIEYWRTIPSFPVYSASNLGRIRNERTGRIMHVYAATNGYLTLTLRRDNVPIVQSVHRLVAEAFLGGPHPGFDVNHIDGDKTNNRIENLEWCTREENIRHAVSTGLRKGPRRRPVRIVETDTVFDSVRACARYYGVDISYINWALKHSGVYRGQHIEYI
jgi:hypothetical protein